MKTALVLAGSLAISAQASADPYLGVALGSQPGINDEFVAAGQGIVTFAWVEGMSEGWAEVLLFIAVVAQTFCTIASVTSASRMMFAFSRDRAVPGWRIWRKVATYMAMRRNGTATPSHRRSKAKRFI